MTRYPPSVRRIVVQCQSATVGCWRMYREVGRWRLRFARILLFVSPVILILVLGFRNEPLNVETRQQLLAGESLAATPIEWNGRLFRWPGDALAEDDWRIFFHETSGRNDITLHQSCAVESAAKHNANRTVQLFMQTGRLNYSSPWLAALANYPNVQVILLDEQEYFKNTPLYDWYKKGVWKTSVHRLAHMSDYIRFLSFQRGGGMFIDLDIITRKPYARDTFWNFIPLESPDIGFTTNAIMHLEKGHRLIDSMIDALNEEYDPTEMIYHGPQALRAVLAATCFVQKGKTMVNRCKKDVHILTHDYFYPIGQPFWDLYYQEADGATMDKVKQCHGVHVPSLHKNLSAADLLQSGKVFAVVARENCPLTVTGARHMASIEF